MGQQVLAVAGQVVGGYFFGPVGAAIGGAIGGYVGGVLFNEDQVFEGPRLSDLKIQTSNYGNAVPIIYGTVRIAGNIIWSTDIRETRLETEQGKGGPDTTQVDYQYDLDCAIALGTPPLGLEFEGIERIYANGVMIYDTRAGASPQNVFASGQWATGTFLYPGNATQMPDPTMEAALGVGNVPAYRGTGYVVITGLQLNVLKTSVLPNFEFVVSTSAVLQRGRQLFEESIQPPYRYSIAGQQPVITQLNTTIRVANTDDALIRVYDLNGDLLGTEFRADDESAFPGFFSRNGAPPFAVWHTFDDKPTDAMFGTIGGTAVFTINGIDMLSVITADTMYGIAACVDTRHFLILTGPAGLSIDEWWLVEWDGIEPLLRDQGTVVGATTEFNIAPVYQGTGQHYVCVMESDLAHIWQVSGSSVFVWEIAAGVMTKIISFTTATLPLKDLAAAGASDGSPAIFADNGLAAIVRGHSNETESYLFLYSRMLDVTPSGMPLVDILTDLCERSDLPAAELSFIGISDNVYGFAVGQTMTARAAIEVLRPPYNFDGVDSDTFKFVKRGAAAVVDFAYGDLGAADGEASQQAVQAAASQETERPARVNVKYMSLSADFQVAAQSARRETTGSRETEEINVPVVFDDDDEPAEIADILLRERWAGAISRTFATTIDYAKYEPTDVATLDDGFAVRTVRLTRRVDKGLLIEWESVDEDVEAYDSNAIAVPIVVAQQGLIVQGPSTFAVLDIPPLTELPSGNESAAYVAAKGYWSPWPGAAIDVSRNDGATYESGTAVTTASVMGAALTELPDFTGGNVFDESSTVRVDVGAGTLSSATHLQVLNGANACVIGDEIVQFRTATLISTGVYDLSGLLRGRKGTEWGIGTHEIGDQFVMLTTNLRNLPLQLSDRVLDSLLVRATTGSLPPSSGTVRSLSPVIARLMPVSPVHLSGTRDGSNDWTLTWVRRDRYMQDWNDLVDVPLSETYELYDVEILVSSVVVETYVDVPVTTQVVPAAVIGSPYTSINFRVYQKSSIVGRGFVAEATITQV